jgi:hypothetical protein
MSNLTLYFSLFFTTFISTIAVISTFFNYENVYIGYDFLFYYLFLDILRYFIFDKNSLKNSILIHHLIGIYYVYIVYNNYETKKEFDKFLLYEISTIFLNIYLLNKTSFNLFIFFMSYTIVRIIFGTYFIYYMLQGDTLSYFNKSLALLFQGINFYWYVYFFKKISQKKYE